VTPRDKKPGGKPGGPGASARRTSVARRDDSDLQWRWAVVALTGLVLLFFYPITFGKVFLSPDSVAPAGFAKIANEALTKRHVYPLWNPFHFLGMPTFGSLAFVPYVYPLDPLFSFLNQGLHFPDLTWLLAHYLLLGLSMLALLRAFGVSAASATFGAFTFALTPSLVAVGAFGHGSQIMTAAYLPLLVFLYDRFVRRGSWLALAGFAVAAAFQLLRGHVQIVFYSWLALGAYALFLAVDAFRHERRGEGARAILGVAGGLALGFGMSAFLYLPVHEYAKLSTRGAGEGGGAGLAYATSWSFHPREMLTFVIPGFFGFGGSTYWGSMPFTDYPNYMGIVPLALALYGAVRARGLTRAYLVALACAALLVSFGKYVQPLYSLLYFHLPFFNKFRVPVMILVLVQFAVATLAAIGLDLALRAPEPGGAKRDPGALWMRSALYAAIGGIAVLVLINVLAPAIRAYAIRSRAGFDEGRARAALDMATVDALKGGILLGAALAIIALARRGKLTRTAAVFLVLAVAVVDLWTIDRRIIDPVVGSPSAYQENFRETPEVTYLRTDTTQYRVLPLRWDDSRLAAYGIASVLGYFPAKPRLYEAFMDTVGIQSVGTLQFLNVKYMLTDGYVPPQQAGITLKHDGDVKVYEIEGALLRASVYHTIQPVRDDGVALAMIRTNGFDAHNIVLWSEPIPPPPVATPATRDSVQTIRYDFNVAEYMVSSAAPGLLLTVEQWDPDWIALVDGTKTTIHRVNYFMRGVALGPGVHRVRFEYAPRALALGIRLSLTAAALTLVLAAFGLIRRGRAGKPEGAPPAGQGTAATIERAG